MKDPQVKPRRWIAGIVWSALGCIGAMGADATAQGTRKFENEARGFEIRIPKWMEGVPTQPGDNLTVARFYGKRPDHENRKYTVELTLLLVRIPKAGEGPTTQGPEGEKPEDADAGGDEAPDATLSEGRLAWLNGAHSVEDYLQRRYRLDGDFLTLNKDLNKAKIKSKDRVQFKPRDLTAERGGHVRVFELDYPAETVAVISLVRDKKLQDRFAREIVRSLKTLKIFPPKAVDADDDPYAESELLDIPKRRRIRRELAEGWEAHDTEHFIVVTNLRKKRELKRLLIDLEIIRKAYFDRFPPAKEANMDVVSTVRVCDSYEDYLRYAGNALHGTGGYWNFVVEELVIYNPGARVPKALAWVADVDPAAVLYHEAMHQYFHYSNVELRPGMWLGEGYGEVFGGADINWLRGELRDIDPNSHRVDLIRRERKEERAIPKLDKLLRMDKPAFYGKGALRHYAYAWAFCYFVEVEREKPERKRNKVWANLPDDYIKDLRNEWREWNDNMSEDAPADWAARLADELHKKAIEKTLKDVDMVELQRVWEEFVNDL